MRHDVPNHGRPGQGQFDSSHDVAADALKMGRERARQGELSFQIVDSDGIAHSVAAFGHVVEVGTPDCHPGVGSSLLRT